jgi:capsular exopolysaccharide synthesis family protein
MESGETRNLSDYLSVLRRRIWLIAGITLLAAGIAVALSMVRSTVYEASTSLSFENPALQAGGVVGAGTVDFFPQQAAAAGAETMTRPDVLKAATEDLGGALTPDELKSDTSVEVDATSNLVTAKVKADTAEEAAQRANALAEATQTSTRLDARNFYRDRARSLGDTPEELVLKARLQTLALVAEPAEIVRPAEVPDSPASPKPVRDTVIAVFLGLMLGVGAAFVRESLDRRATDPREVQRRLGIPLVGYVRKESLGMAGMSPNGSGRVAEADLESFRILRKNVDFLGGGDKLNVVAVTSPLPDEGKSTVASWYAYSSALVGRRTILVECDFRRPVSASRLRFDPKPGLSDFLAGEAEPKEVLRTIDVEGRGAEILPVIPAGEAVVQPTELLASQAFKDFLGQLRKAYDLVVIDCAPLLPVGDTLEILPEVDALLLCVRLRQTTLEQASAAKEAMAHLAEKPRGLVITGLTRRRDDGYYGYYSSTVESPRSSEESLR